jgi:hypothetical protein
MTLATVRRILARSRIPPVILLQGDHGTDFLRWANPAHVRERSGAFGAYYLPDGGARSWPDTVTPVNLFRLVFDTYFGTDLPLLSNAVYPSTESAPYVFRAGKAERAERLLPGPDVLRTGNPHVPSYRRAVVPS